MPGNSAHGRLLTIIILAGWCIIGSAYQGLSAPSDHTRLTDNRQPRQAGVHDAGDLYLPFFGPQISVSHCLINSFCNPETGEELRSLMFPQGSGKRYMATGAIWIGGIIDGDTIVSQAFDDLSGVNEFCPEDRYCGGLYRIGDFADDEFMAAVVDTSPPAPSRTLGLRLTSVSYTWADTLYDDFAVITYTIHNIKDRPISDGWAGIFLHNDIYQNSPLENHLDDEYSGALDTLLYDDDPASRVLIPYGIDNDGDPLSAAGWGPFSVRGAVSVRLLGADFDIRHQNFNWWSGVSGDASDFGPRRLGTPDDPLRLFGTGRLGAPTTDEEQYYIMAHPEIDYDQVNILLHDSADGWVPVFWEVGPAYADGSAANSLLSFGPFDLAPGDSVSFTLAVVLADNVHRDPGDFAAYHDPYHPQALYRRLDFGPLMAQHRRADSVYKSGLTLPIPGPPQGLVVSDYRDAQVKLSWWPSRRPDLAGYFLCAKNPAGQWMHASPGMITDTVGILYVPDPKQTYELAVSAVDTRGRESNVSMPVSILPGRPHPVENLDLRLDGMIPEISWVPHDDTTVQAFIIDRSIWDGPFQVYDSTTNWSYHDLQAESGVQYAYRVTVKNRLGLESFPAGPASVLPMAMNKGVLFCNLNRISNYNTGPFQTKYLDRLYQSAAGVYPMTRFNRANRDLSFKQMADYSLIIIDWERFEDGLTPVLVDSLKYYLKGGGRLVLIVLSACQSSITIKPTTNCFEPGSFFHDFLKLDSSVTNGYMFAEGAFHGDLYGCRSVTAEYRDLEADLGKLAASPTIPVEGCVPMAGYLFPSDEAEPLYRYVSSVSDTINQGQINGIRYLGDDYRFALFTFPLTMMKEPVNFRVLRQALIDMGLDMSCGDIKPDGVVNIGDVVTLVNYLFRGGSPPAMMDHADIDCNGMVDMADVLGIINLLFKNGAGLHCCP